MRKRSGPPRWQPQLAGLLLLALWTVAAGQAPFRFAWLSDLHVGSTTGSRDLRRVVADINTQSGLAFVIVSGDITELETGTFLDSARLLLDSLRIPYHLIPGNHDTKWSASGGTKFRKLWGADRFSFEFGGVRFIGFHQGPLLRMGPGYVAPEDLRWLQQTISGLADPQQPLIVVTHYPLDASVTNWIEVLRSLASGNVRAVLHGHGHANRREDLYGFRGVMGRSTLRGPAAAGGYNLVNVYADSLVFTERIPGDSVRKPWAVLRDEDLREPDSSGWELPAIPAPGIPPVLWSWSAGAAIVSQAGANRELAVTAATNGTVTALDLDTGRPRWSVNSASPVVSAPAVTDRYVVITGTDSSITCLDSGTGTRVWTVKTGAPLVADPAVVGNTVYTGAGDGVFRALRLQDGKVRWRFRGVNGFVEARPLVTGKRVVFGAWDGNLYCLRAGNGRLLWRWSGGRPGVLYSPAACRPVVSGNRVFVVAPDRVLSAVDLKTGGTLWRSGRWSVRESVGISPVGNTVFTKCMWDTLVAWTDLDQAVPTTEWAVPAGFGFDINPAAPVVTDGRVYFSTQNGVVYACSRSDGTILWTRKVSTSLVHTVTPAGEGRLLVTGVDGRVHLLRDDYGDN